MADKGQKQKPRDPIDEERTRAQRRENAQRVRAASLGLRGTFLSRDPQGSKTTLG